MDRMLYVSMTGAKQTMQAQMVSAHNLANASTTGFRRELTQFQALALQGPGYASRAYAVNEGVAVDQSLGPISATGRDMDMAIQGQGWIAVQANDGSEAYTRAGNLQVSANGMLLTGAGHPVLGDSGPISIPPAEKLEIGADGTISIRGLGQGPATMTVVERIKLVDPPPEQLVRGEDGLMRTADGLPAAPDAGVRLVSGALESSNVNTVDAMVSMIALARQFEMQVKMMEAAKDADTASTKMLSMG